MSTETHHYFGISLTEDFDRIQDALAESLGVEDVSLQDFLEKNELGHSHYDGGGYGQVTYIGVDVPMTEQGIVVTDEIRAEVARIIAGFPDEFLNALIGVYGNVPEAAFDYEQSDG
ncbi:hypothetical protein G6L37_00165 [Agrobacterium rubi]|nr:hypothetical protein [Agrobacterium rubi]NTF23664.1 hypothetical protein [Agrobacterium rubi]